MMSTSNLVSTVLPTKVWASTVMVLGGLMSGGRMVLLFCGEDRHLLLQCCKVGLVFEQEDLAVGVGVGKIGYIGSRIAAQGEMQKLKRGFEYRARLIFAEYQSGSAGQ